ncbi:MAG: hypothetical protein Q7N95_17935 [Alphaproteobacteria bacterium]|nr:hypothetical protein [Alphaproteobacteria bacterium]
MKNTLMIAVAMVVLSACASQPPKTLDQKLQGVNTQERKEVLRLACLNEAAWPTYHSPAYKQGNIRIRRRLEHTYDPEVSDMKALCRKMDALADAGAKKKLFPEVLASICAEKVSEKIHRSRRGGADHAQRIEKICEEMTGQKI